MRKLAISVLLERHIVSSSRNDDKVNPCIYIEESEMKKCKDGMSEFNPTLNREKVERAPEQERYGGVYAEIELPKLLKK